MKNTFVLLTIALVISLTSCSSYIAPSNENVSSGNEGKLTLMVYMAADNDLESAALEDLNEMEAAFYDEEKITVLVLLDRSDLYDNSNGNWSSTRLYKVKHDANGMNKTIVSEQLPCPELSLELSHDSELDMSSKKTLSGLLSYSCRAFPADRYALVMWGHGTGWRGLSLDGISYSSKKVKAFAFDDNGGGYMHLCTLREAIEDGMKDEVLEFIGFDTCFGAELEVCYELKNCARWLCGTEGLSPYSGWNYTTWLHEISRNISAGQDFFSLPEPKDDTSFAVVSLSHIGELFASFDSLASSLTKCICSEDDVESLKKLVRSAGLLFVPNAKSEAYISIYDFLSAVESEFPHLAEEIKDVERDLFNSVQTRTSNGHIPLGVFVCELDASGDISSPFPASYVNGSGEKNQCAFVKDSVGYVPTFAGGGLLGMLFRKNNF